MKIEVLKIADIHQDQILSSTRDFIQVCCRVEYLDATDNEEPIYNLRHLVEDIEHGEKQKPADQIFSQLLEIEAFMDEHELAYLRINNH